MRLESTLDTIMHGKFCFIPPPTARDTELLLEKYLLDAAAAIASLPLFSKKKAKLFLQKMWASSVH